MWVKFVIDYAERSNIVFLFLPACIKVFWLSVVLFIGDLQQLFHVVGCSLYLMQSFALLKYCLMLKCYFIPPYLLNRHSLVSSRGELSKSRWGSWCFIFFSFAYLSFIFRLSLFYVIMACLYIYIFWSFLLTLSSVIIFCLFFLFILVLL